MRIRQLVFLVPLLLACAATDSSAAGQVVKDIEFANVDGQSLKLDLHLPETPKGSRLVVWIHGGGWRAGSKNRCSLSWLSGYGYTVASISYRFSSVATFPAQLHDCKAAIRWLRAHAPDHGYLADRIAVAGSSAGGHLAALLGTTGGNDKLEGKVGGNLDHSSRVQAVVDFYGATDFILRSRTQPSRANKEGSVVYNLLGGGADKKVELARLASAVYHVTTDDPPLLIFHGDMDKTVLLDQSQAIDRAYRKAGRSVEFHVLAGSKHGGTEFFTGRNGRHVFEFLQVHLNQAAAGKRPTWKDPDSGPRRYILPARASTIDSRAGEHPEIDFVFTAGGKVQDLQQAIVDTRVAPRGKLVIWLMRHNPGLFERLSGYGLHAIQVHYANRWFGKICRENPVGEMCRGDARLEAATGEDHSPNLTIPRPDGMMERSRQFVIWLARKNPQGEWSRFLTPDGNDLQWENVIVAGISHGSTTAARFAVHRKVSRVVMFSGPRDQYQTWQKLPSATPTNRFFGFTHVLDTGWSGDHYCRSWELLGLHKHGAIVDVDKSAAPFGHSRRLVSTFDVGGNTRRAHGAVVPGGSARRDTAGKFLHEAAWKYLFTHPVEKTGKAVPQDKNCNKNQRKK
ncbi:MAG: alpha/beta hydrolase [Planctomycetaceae bacterium]